MKTKFLVSLIFFCSTALVHAQFLDKNGNSISSCDCKDPVRDLDVSVDLPDTYTQYDFIQFVLYAGKNAVSGHYMKPNEINANTIKLNVLNSVNKATRSAWGGYEYGLFHGSDFTSASYSSLCQFMSDQDVYVVVYGISQIGTETQYNIDYTQNKVTSRTYKVYDNGIEISRTGSVTFKQDKEYSKSIARQHRVGYALGAVAVIGSIVSFVVL